MLMVCCSVARDKETDDFFRMIVLLRAATDYFARRVLDASSTLSVGRGAYTCGITAQAVTRDTLLISIVLGAVCFEQDLGTRDKAYR